DDEQENYDQLVKRLDMRYSNAHLEQVNQTQLRNRYQSSKEKLQEFEVDVAHMVCLAHPTAPDCLASQTIIYGVRDSEIQQALRLARPKTLDDVLAYALDHEAAKQASRNQSQVRNIDAERNENTEIQDERVRRIVTDVFAKKRNSAVGIAVNWVIRRDFAEHCKRRRKQEKNKRCQKTKSG
ncbi:hypothetical protein CBL_21372, partial [Carabus blaptoides fortunei]